MRDNLAYYESRAAREAEAARTSALPEIAVVHRRLAEEYAEHVRKLRAD